MNITFEHIHYLYYGVMAILFFAVFAIITHFRKKKLISSLSEQKFLKNLLVLHSNTRLKIKYLLRFLVIVFLALAAANPREYSKQQKNEVLSSEIVFCFDISTSMLADDVSPSRFEFSKQLILKTLANLGDDKVGMVVYAGTAVILQPMTTDINMLKGVIRTIQTDFISLQGTNIEEAVDKSLRLFESESTADKILILITDGEEHDGNLKSIANKVSDLNVKVLVVGVGTINGSPIPFYGNNEKNFKRDKYGNVVITKLDEDRLREFALKTKGVYYRASGLQQAFDFIEKELNNVNRQDEIRMAPSGFVNLYYIPLIIACFLLFIDFLVLDYLFFLAK